MDSSRSKLTLTLILIVGVLTVCPVVMLVLAATVGAMACLMIKSAFGKEPEEAKDYTGHWSVRLTKRLIAVEPTLADGKFFVRKEGRIYVTVCFLTLVCIESADVGFAFDSMPAIAAVVRNPAVMLVSTMMAVAGLRSLYFALLGANNRLCHLDKAVALLLVYVTLKLLIDAFEVCHVSSLMNLLIVAGFLLAGVAASLVWPEQTKE